MDEIAMDRGTDLRWPGIGLLLFSGLIHLYLAPEHFAEAPYLGTLFALFFLASLAAAYGIYRDRRWGWTFGVSIVVVAIALWAVHVTVGLPVVGAESPFEPIAVVDKLAELAFLGVAAYHVADARSAARSSVPTK